MIEFLDGNGQKIDTFNLNLKVSSKDMTLNIQNGNIVIESVKKAGKYTITATANDGAKSTYKLDIINTGVITLFLNLIH